MTNPNKQQADNDREMKPIFNSLEDFAQFLMKFRIVDENAFYCSEGYDGGLTMNNLSMAFDGLNRRYSSKTDNHNYDKRVFLVKIKQGAAKACMERGWISENYHELEEGKIDFEFGRKLSEHHIAVDFENGDQVGYPPEFIDVIDGRPSPKAEQVVTCKFGHDYLASNISCPWCRAQEYEMLAGNLGRENQKLQSALTRAEAESASMRETLNHIPDYLNQIGWNDSHGTCNAKNHTEVMVRAVRHVSHKALSGTAGKSLLEKMGRMEAVLEERLRDLDEDKSMAELDIARANSEESKKFLEHHLQGIEIEMDEIRAALNPQKKEQ